MRKKHTAILILTLLIAVISGCAKNQRYGDYLSENTTPAESTSPSESTASSEKMDSSENTTATESTVSSEDTDTKSSSENVTSSENNASSDDSVSSTENTASSENATSSNLPALPDDKQNTGAEQSSFIIESENKYDYDSSSNTYTITLAGTYDCYGDLYEGQIIVSADDDAEITITLNGCTITNSTDSPILVLNADKVDISAKKDTENKIYDLRSISSDDAEEDATGGAIYAKCDLTLKGNGALEVISNYNNGVFTKDDLKIKNLTLTVTAVNNAIKGNDSITIESGNITVISTGGDALKTTSTDTNKNGKQRGFVEINGGEITLYAACDGIDSASDVIISGDAVLNIYTDTYSPYSQDVMTSSSSLIYLRLNSTVYNANYKYSAYFYNTDGTYQWKDMSFYKQSVSSSFPGGRGGNKGGGTTYYYFSVEKPSGYSNVRFYAYSSEQTPGQSQNYVAVSSSDTTISKSWDTYVVTSVSAASGSIVSSGWTNYQSQKGNTGLDYSCKGIKAGNIILIEGGTINITAKDDGLHANFDEILESTAQKGLGNIIISGGNIAISSDDDGIHADQDLMINGGVINVITSYEGLEANRIYISDGHLTAYAKDDGINANSKGAYSAYIEISGGVIDVSVPSGDTDTLDSNGTILISGGNVFLKNGQMSGSSMGGGTIDTDRGITVTGGTVIAIGCIGNKISGSTYSTSQSFTAGNYSIKDSTGKSVADFELTASYKACMFWSDAFVNGETYTIYMGSQAIADFVR